ncbi:baseplate J/gp47 family protein [Paenibacillus agilis]|uniref:Baseplate J/gp47 family protein n=1 Tax=Paenibacillus agilis TaxID=3020863 RepID=A0A559IX73_9BACL|nr:baseplate J/gp47 family protein [Paenibacillus agilis]TVX92230.1 baseplate J/gp47 family protein [Paenibacillus agilis]
MVEKLRHFEEEEYIIQQRMLDHARLAEWRKEPGDFIYDVVAPVPLEVQQLQISQDTILRNAFPQFAEGEYMDAHLEEIGLKRHAATPNKRQISITADAGVIIPADHTASVVVLDDNGNPLEFAVDTTTTFAAAGIHAVSLTCRTAGAITNVPVGTQFILLPPIPGIRSITDIGPTIIGRDQESDADAWQRYLLWVSNEDTGGNKNDYVRWSVDFQGVGKAKCIPRWNGNNTVKIVIVGTDYRPASTTVVNKLQEYIDPGSTGLGEGKAPCGAKVTVETAQGLQINISVKLVLDNGFTVDQVRAAFMVTFSAYLTSLVFVNDSTGKPYPVAYNQIGAKLLSTKGVVNYSELTLNGGTLDIPVGPTQTPVTGDVIIR